jgi:ABC-2 type transport system permease protein
VRVKYGSSVLGYFWSLLEPLMLTAVYYLIFTVLLERARFGIENYALFLMLGVLPWLWVSTTVSASMRALRGQSRLITKVRIPREIFPLSVVGAKTFEFLASWLVIIGIAVVAGVPPTMNAVYLPVVFVIQILLIMGLALFLSSVNVMLRDVERMTRILLRAGFYLSPVIYPVQRFLDPGKLPDWVRLLYQMNPLVGIFGFYRSIFYPETFPTTTMIVSAVSVSAVVFVVGYWTFIRLEPAVLKEL